MATVNQLVRKPRKDNIEKTNVPALEGCPQSTVLGGHARTGDSRVATGDQTQHPRPLLALHDRYGPQQPGPAGAVPGDVGPQRALHRIPRHRAAGNPRTAGIPAAGGAHDAEGIAACLKLSPAHRSIRPAGTVPPSATPALDTGHGPSGSLGGAHRLR